MEHCGPKGTVLAKASRAKPYAGSDTRQGKDLAPSTPPGTPAANQLPSEQKTTPAPVSQRPKRNNKEPEYFNH